jgi:hypothetical protein
MKTNKQIKRLKVYQKCRILLKKATIKKINKREKLLIAKRRKIVFDMRVSGKSYRQIGKALGISQVTVYKDIMFITQKMEEKTIGIAQKDRQIELTRLDKMYNSLEPGLRRGDHFAIDRALKIMAQRAKYIPGYEEPNKLQISGDKENPIEFEMRQKEVYNTLKRLCPEYGKKIKDAADDSTKKDQAMEESVPEL